uniref:Uncharacterized protein n=1 Tax=Uncultured archaeon GZfos26G2 TaxID=3386331 RepID=Q648H9_UNCAG|nr:hypothetical protein GZ37D1_45 [uncultured archaeon GZfos37D1]
MARTMINENGTVIFKSNPLIYQQERDGQKPNTTRIIETKDWDKLLDNCPHKIIIVSNIQGQRPYFEREITNISKLWHMFDKTVITISWQHVTEEAQDEKS